MKIIEILSKQDMLTKLRANEKNYVLIYKSDSVICRCAYDNLAKTEDVDSIQILGVDVLGVKDVHLDYGITSVPTLVQFTRDKFEKIIKGCESPEFYKSLFTKSLYVSKTGQKSEIKQKQVIVYSTPTCSWCTRLKSYLKNNNITFRDIDVSKNQSAATRMVAKSGQQGVPQTEIDGQIIVGFDKKKIDNLLNIK